MELNKFILRDILRNIKKDLFLAKFCWYSMLFLTVLRIIFIIDFNYFIIRFFNKRFGNNWLNLDNGHIICPFTIVYFVNIVVVPFLRALNIKIEWGQKPRDPKASKLSMVCLEEVVRFLSRQEVEKIRTVSKAWCSLIDSYKNLPLRPLELKLTNGITLKSLNTGKELGWNYDVLMTNIG